MLLLGSMSYLTKHVFIAEFRGYELRDQLIGRDDDLVFETTWKAKPSRQTDQMNITPFFLNY